MLHKVAVVGCGAIGVTTALAIQKKIPNSAVTIFTKEVSPYTTSDIAAGLWEPIFLNNTSEENIVQWSRGTYVQLLKWWREGEAKTYGICLLPRIYFTDNVDVKPPKWLDLTLGYGNVSASVLAEMSKRCGIKLTTGFYFISFTVEVTIFLEALQREFTENGGKIIIKEIKDLNELSAFDVILNCTGLGSRDLMGDSQVAPIRGQVKKVKAPWLFHSISFITSTRLGYIIPNAHVCTLGGTANYNNGDTVVDETDNKNIERNCLGMLPSLKSAKIIRDMVGLRPGRNEVRVETEVIKTGDKALKVIHNYGHGGAGITLCLGCAEEATDLLQILLTKHKI